MTEKLKVQEALATKRGKENQILTIENSDYVFKDINDLGIKQVTDLTTEVKELRQQVETLTDINKDMVKRFNKLLELITKENE